jgi:alkyldihydroxyacetonephosphate synthase
VSTLPDGTQPDTEGPDHQRTYMRWDGWGDPARAHGLPTGVKLLLTAVLGRLPKAPAAPRLAEVTLSTPPLADDDLAALAKAVGDDHVDAGHDVRLLHAGGKSTPDLLRRRQAVQVAPGAVVLPATEEEVAAVLAVAGERGLAVVPFGGGTAVTGGLTPDAGSHRGVVSLDLHRLSGLVALDELAQEAASPDSSTLRRRRPRTGRSAS